MKTRLRLKFARPWMKNFIRISWVISKTDRHDMSHMHSLCMLCVWKTNVCPSQSFLVVLLLMYVKFFCFMSLATMQSFGWHHYQWHRGHCIQFCCRLRIMFKDSVDSHPWNCHGCKYSPWWGHSTTGRRWWASQDTACFHWDWFPLLQWHRGYSWLWVSFLTCGLGCMTYLLLKV